VYADKWEQVFVTWNSGSATSATIKVVDILPVLLGNDFGLDDFFFGEIVTCFDSITVTASEKVKLGNDTIISPGQPIVISPVNGPYAQYRWSTGDTTRAISINEAGLYRLSATDQNGCESADTIIIKSSLYQVVFPNAFSPNGDGVNDVFRPCASNVSDFRMSVYNRWGQFLFETDEIAAGWNGMFNGKDCPADLYVYIASYKLQDPDGIKTARGSFRLIR
jgi:gliding motility-associated-like protein